MANSVGSFGQQIAQAAEDGYILSIVTPDWRSKNHEKEIGHLEGKMGLMPLPAITPGGRRTSTWGGTMLGITKHCKNQDLAWEFAKFLYVDKKEELAKRFEATNIIPPVRAAWDLPEFKKPHPYYGGQQLGLEYARLAPEVPAQYSSPYVELAKSKYTQALIASVDYYKRNGDKGFEAFVRANVKARADEVRKVMERTRTLQGEAAPVVKEATRK
jgi:ABC-type glycerol-3-phosphate transport system substrate-binding protein